jgi:hypothetical protein
MKVLMASMAIVAATFFVGGMALADPIGGASSSVSFCAAPSGGPAALADEACDGCGCKGSKGHAEDGKKGACGDKTKGDKGSCGCSGDKAGDEKNEKGSCGGGGDEAALDNFLGGLERPEYACGCGAQ